MPKVGHFKVISMTSKCHPFFLKVHQVPFFTWPDADQTDPINKDKFHFLQCTCPQELMADRDSVLERVTLQLGQIYVRSKELELFVLLLSSEK